MKKIAFVIPWFGKNIPGGAESACRSISSHIREEGFDVEILTTCIKEFKSDWSKNFYPEGIEIIDKVPVRRFKVQKCDKTIFDGINYKIIHQMPITKEEEKTFFNEMIKCPDLSRYIRENEKDYQAFLFIPYMFTTSIEGVKSCPSKSILIPCLHEESYAHLTPIKHMMEQAKGIIYLADAEKELAEKSYQIGEIKNQVIGTGIDNEITFDINRFKDKYSLKNPFILYAGRKDAGKNIYTLLEYFEKFMTQNPLINLDLVMIGGGTVDIPKKIKERVYDLGYVQLQDKYDAYGAADLLCQPSLNESFSIVIMESWMCETPVLVSGQCVVTKQFCERSNAGLYFNDYEEFSECINFFINNTEISKRMGHNGKQFVADNFLWHIVTKKYVDFIGTYRNER